MADNWIMLDFSTKEKGSGNSSMNTHTHTPR